MDISPQRVRSAEFKSVRKGVDPEQVRTFLNEVADELERAQNQATAMEARARAAVARLQEVGESTPAKPDTAAAPAVIEPSAEEAETISRTLLLAQRTADTTVAEARAEADRLLRGATDEAAATRDSTREMAAQLLEEARIKARQAGEAERLNVAGEVDSLKARRDFLESDVEHLELFLTDQRNRIREAATSLLDVTDRVPAGLGAVRPPLLSAADEESSDDDASNDAGGSLSAVTWADERHDGAGSAESTEAADAGDIDDDVSDDDDLVIQTDIADEADDELSDGDEFVDGDGDELAWDDRDAPTQAMPTVESARSDDDSGGFRFSFDDDRT